MIRVAAVMRLLPLFALNAEMMLSADLMTGYAKIVFPFTRFDGCATTERSEIKLSEEENGDRSLSHFRCGPVAGDERTQCQRFD